MGAATIAGSYCDVGHSESVRYLRDALAPRIIHYGLDDLDAGRPPAACPTSAHAGDQPLRLHPGGRQRKRCFSRDSLRVAAWRRPRIWAIFEPNEPTTLSSAEIDEDDAYLQAVLMDYKLKFVD
jgi:hypothetical protein